MGKRKMMGLTKDDGTNLRGSDQKRGKQGPQDETTAHKPFVSKFPFYTPLNTLREKILMQVEGENVLKYPGSMRSTTEK